ncbi:MAG: cation diffusion facilitator family transporter [Thermacetogeniaceae bacterium]
MAENTLPATEQKAAAARLSVSSNALLVILKLAVGIAIGSVSVLSEAIHSGIDLLAALLALFAVKRSGEPPDEDHQYGHGKIENVSGVVESILIFLAAVWIVMEAVHRLENRAAVQTPLWGMAVMGLSGLVNLFISSNLMKTARATDSIALEADAWHLRTDVFTSFGVAVGLLLIWITGRSIIDPVLAIGVALLIIKASCDLAAKAFSPLLDARLPLDEEEEIRQIILGYGAQYIGFHELRTRKSGSERHIDLHLVAPWDQSIARSHELCDQIEQAVGERYPGARILIHVEPCREGDDCSLCTARCESRPDSFRNR